MKNAEAIRIIRSNWPNERYTMLREALTKAIVALEAIRIQSAQIGKMKEIGSSNEVCPECGEHNQAIVLWCRNCAS